MKLTVLYKYYDLEILLVILKKTLVIRKWIIEVEYTRVTQIFDILNVMWHFKGETPDYI